MYHLMIKTHFSAAHNLINYQGDCENLHGHNWRVEVTVSARELDKAGLGIDFKILKKKTNQLLDKFDHKHLNELEPFLDVSPSSENLCRYIHEQLSRELNNANIRVEKISVWESENACASYIRD